jgi:hypothetical protein
VRDEVGAVSEEIDQQLDLTESSYRASLHLLTILTPSRGMVEVFGQPPDG